MSVSVLPTCMYIHHLYVLGPQTRRAHWIPLELEEVAGGCKLHVVPGN